MEQRHGTRAVHTANELKMLRDKFPDNIKLFGAFCGKNLVAGSVLYISELVVHTQYMAANDLARRLGALDLVINTIIERYRGEKQWLDFGISTEHNRIYLNEGLIAQKEGFGGRTGVYETWILNLQ